MLHNVFAIYIRCAFIGIHCGCAQAAHEPRLTHLIGIAPRASMELWMEELPLRMVGGSRPIWMVGCAHGECTWRGAWIDKRYVQYCLMQTMKVPIATLLMVPKPRSPTSFLAIWQSVDGHLFLLACMRLVITNCSGRCCCFSWVWFLGQECGLTMVATKRSNMRVSWFCFHRQATCSQLRLGRRIQFLASANWDESQTLFSPKVIYAWG